jgi:hypothetical protein
LIERPQRLDGDETQEPDSGFHAALNDGMAQGGMSCDLVTDDDEAQIAILRVVLDFAAQHGKGLHQARDVFLWIGSAHVEQERVVDAVAVEYALILWRMRVFPPVRR